MDPLLGSEVSVLSLFRFFTRCRLSFFLKRLPSNYRAWLSPLLEYEVEKHPVWRHASRARAWRRVGRWMLYNTEEDKRSSALCHLHQLFALTNSNHTMAESSTGIQELMAAETRASQIVAEARIGE